MAHCLLLMNHK